MLKLQCHVNRHFAHLSALGGPAEVSKEDLVNDKNFARKKEQSRLLMIVALTLSYSLLNLLF